MRRQAGDIYLVRTLGLVAAGLVMIAIAGLLALAAWWLRTWRSERLRLALFFLLRHVPGFAMMAAGIGLLAYLEDRLKWPSLLAYATSLGVVFAICNPWWRWAYPAIERALLRARYGALRAVVILAIAVGASGIWAYALF